MCHTMSLLIILLVPAVYSYPSGAPPQACSTMRPWHNHAPPSTATNPYNIALSANTYDCNGSINVTLSGTGSTQFKGFLCQARPNPSISLTVGALTDIGSTVTSTNKCTGRTSITHNSNSTKSAFNFSWTHSGTTNGNVYIVCTVVKTKLDYWMNLQSALITHSGSTATC